MTSINLSEQSQGGSGIADKKKPTTVAKRVQGIFHTIDLFGFDVSFRENGNSQLTTNCGSFVSLLIFILIVIYGSNKFTMMVTKGDTNY